MKQGTKKETRAGAKDKAGVGAEKEARSYEIERVQITKLKPHPRNYRIHPDEQLDHIVKSIEEHGFYRNIVVSKDHFILAGHGVVKAAERMGLTDVPVMRMSIKADDPKALKIMTGDNEISRLAQNDEALLFQLLGDIMKTDDLLGSGFNQDMLEDLMESISPEKGSDYVSTIEAPIYTPKGEKPKLSELCDTEKSGKLLEEIEAADIPADVKTFLALCADRHNVFNYELIAEYYAHAPKKIQALMEKSALVIIDFKKAIENGFVTMAEEIAGQYPAETPNEN